MDFLEHFEHICSIPHCSFETKKLGDFLLDYTKKQGFSAVMDESGNIHAVFGTKPKVCLQAHYDMVCVGDAPKIELINDGELLKARNSTLGADNGIGVAIIMEMMSECVKKGKDLEVLFTNNEEVGLLGAGAFAGKIASPALLNLDSEDENEVIIGCAGGINATLSKEFALKECGAGEIYELSVAGLPGGHSGMEIHKGVPNAICVLLEYIVKNNCRIISINGGERNNAIPTFAKALVYLKSGKEPLKSSNLVKIKKISQINGGFWRIKGAKKLAHFIASLPHGVLGWDNDLSQVKTSINLAIVSSSDAKTTNENTGIPNFDESAGLKEPQKISICLYARSSDENELESLAMRLASHAELAGFKTHFSERSLPWQPQQSEFANSVLKALQRQNPSAKLSSIHAGLECGVLGAKNKGLMACSIGPNIKGAHTINECCEINSAKKICEVVKEILEFQNEI